MKYFLFDLLYLLAIVITIAIILGIGYWVSVSDLPDWFKFFILS